MEERVLKRWLKRKVKITEALLIGFLITGGISYGLDLGAVNDENISVDFTFTTTPTKAEETEMTAAWPIIPPEITDFTNSAKIVSSYTETNIKGSYINPKTNRGNGMDPGTHAPTIDNTGTISGYIKLNGYRIGIFGRGSGNGINTYSINTATTIGDITNSGILKAESDLQGGNPETTYYNLSSYSTKSWGTGNGISSYSSASSTIGNITNSGTIKVKNYLRGGNISLEDSSVSSVSTTSLIESLGSGNGISAYGSMGNTINNIKNKGIIEGEAELKGGSNWLSRSSKKRELIASGYIKSLGTGNGTSAYSSGTSAIGEIQNRGIIGGYADLKTQGVTSSHHTTGITIVPSTAEGYIESLGTANGVSSYGVTTSTVGEVKNKGIVQGYLNVTRDVVRAISEDTLGNRQATAVAKAYVQVFGSGNGVNSYGGNGSSSISNTSNSGILRGDIQIKSESMSASAYTKGTTSASGTAYAKALGSGNGMSSYGTTASTLGEVKNNGTVSGYASIMPGRFSLSVGLPASPTTTSGIDYAQLSFSGDGIALKGNISSSITNSGLIKGSQSAIAAPTINAVINNYGTMAGRKIYSNGEELKRNSTTDTSILSDIVLGTSTFTDPTQENNLGIYVNLKDIFSGEGVTGGDFVGMISDAEDEKYAFVQSVDIGSSGTDTKATITSPDGNQTSMTIINANPFGEIASTKGNILAGESSLDTYVKVSNLKSGETPLRENLIINGVGQIQGALVVDEKTVDFKNSIINGYNTALFVEDTNTFTGTDVIFNGGGLRNNIAVIKGGITSGLSGMYVTLKKNSIINGLVEMGAGESDILSLSNPTQVNGDLDGGAGDHDVINLGDGTEGELIILHDIRNFESINSKGTVSISETSKVTGLKNLEITDGDLFLRIDPTVTNEDKEVIGHALYENGTPVAITSTGGNLKVGLNGAGKGTIIHLGTGNTMDSAIDSVYDEDDRLRTSNPILDAVIHDSGTNEKIIIASTGYLPKPEPPEPPEPPTPPEPEPPTPVEPGIPDTPVVPPASDIVVPSEPHNYDIMNDIYLSALSVDEEEKLSGDIDDYNQGVYEIYSILDQIYANNPYGYSLRAARDSMVLFEDALSYFTIKPNLHEWIVQGKALYSHVEDKNEGTKKYKIRSNSAGGLASAEYGLTQETS